MNRITVAAEELAKPNNKVLKENTPNHRAIEIIRKLDLDRIIRGSDLDGVIASLLSKEIVVIKTKERKENFRLKITLNEQTIYADPQFEDEQEHPLKSISDLNPDHIDNFYSYSDRKFCTIL